MRWLCCALLSLGCAGSVPPPRASSLPEIPIRALDGQATTLGQVSAGAVTLVDLWATWCTACEQERPKLERLAAAYGPRGLRVVGLDVGEDPSVVSAYLTQHPRSYPVFLDPEFELADALGDKQLPTLLLVDAEGRIEHRSASLDHDMLSRIKARLPPAK